MGHMRGRKLGWACVLLAGLALLPARAFGQGEEFPRPDVELPFPLGHDRMDKGGLYLGGEFVMYKQTNPIKNQGIAFSGFTETSGGVFGITGIPGQFVGSHALRLDAEQVAGPSTYQPGFKVLIGWRFEDASALEVSYMNLQKAVYNATATLIPPGLQVGVNQVDTFLFSPVYNFPLEYGGPLNKVGSLFPFNIPGTVFGIWNGASLESIEFDQRTTQIEAVYRKPIFETECYRCYGLIGPRFFWIWERFKWRTVSYDANGNAGPTDAAIYTNIVSNRMYGGHMGFGQEWYMGHGVALSLDLEAALLLDIVKERAKYELGEKDLAPQNKRAITDYTVVPELQANLNVWWYPTEAVQVRVGYDVMTFFNTKGFHSPVDFKYGSVAPAYEHVFRYFHGLNAGIALIF
jgi:hypothetical protein